MIGRRRGKQASGPFPEGWRRIDFRFMQGYMRRTRRNWNRTSWCFSMKNGSSAARIGRSTMKFASASQRMLVCFCCIGPVITTASSEASWFIRALTSPFYRRKWREKRMT